MRDPAVAKLRLIAVLRAAYSGERAAALAYVGHARSVRDVGEREHIARIGAEEVAHRQRVGEMLADLGSTPSAVREVIFWCIGRTISALCHVIGWYCPMYGAGWIERRNIQEYVDAARFANEAGRADLADELLVMAQVEWDHEQWFRTKVLAHWMHRVLPVWRAPPPRADLARKEDAPRAPALT
jgi:demethoxyubiquinone hydroxylase (CLK1/Coq7/Cat5 family)